MISLKIKISFLVISSLLVFSCQTSQFKILKQDEDAVQLKVSRDRIVLNCEYQKDNDTKNAYGFLIFVLDVDNTVTTIAQTNILDKKSCDNRIKKINKILNTRGPIYIVGSGYLNKPKVKGDFKVSFKNRGDYFTNGLGMQFMQIYNSEGKCFHAYRGEDPPCPEFPY